MMVRNWPGHGPTVCILYRTLRRYINTVLLLLLLLCVLLEPGGGDEANAGRAERSASGGD